MDNGTNSESGKVSAGLEDGGESVRGRCNAGVEHATVEEDGVEGEAGGGGGFEEGVEEEGVGVDGGA